MANRRMEQSLNNVDVDNTYSLLPIKTIDGKDTSLVYC